ncbi:shikimate dehydrogenase family protein [Rhodococcus opacus]|uniref:shikimate dehydrogenase family protein n=1 Tax=Rhodococcus opacus TaxID=37919 RepID=UPI00031610AF|nr:shikimate dehydrogenase [Rhodococcus opacus]
MPVGLPISGNTILFALVGDPVRQAMLPTLFNPMLAEQGVDAVMLPVHAPQDRFDEVMRGLQAIGNVAGIAVTVPHKSSALAYADEITPAAEAIGAINALRRNPDGTWTGDNFDGRGFVAGLAASDIDPAGLTVTLVGTGGAGSALAVALLDAGVGTLRLYDRDTTKATEVAARVEQRSHGTVRVTDTLNLTGADLVINATPLGMHVDDPLPFDPTGLEPHAVVADIIMKPDQTPVMKRARELGYMVHPGLHMLTNQLDCYRKFFSNTLSAVGSSENQV